MKNKMFTKFAIGHWFSLSLVLLLSGFVVGGVQGQNCNNNFFSVFPTSTVTPATCGLADGSMTISFEVGNLGSGDECEFKISGNGISDMTFTMTGDGNENAPDMVSETISGLGAGTYTVVTVTLLLDNGDDGQIQPVNTNGNVVIPEAIDFTLAFDTIQPTCIGGDVPTSGNWNGSIEVTVTPSGIASMYTYRLIDTGNGNVIDDFGPNSMTTHTFSGLDPDDYIVSVEDESGCIDSSGVITLNDLDDVTFTTTPTDPFCEMGNLPSNPNGSIEINVTAGTPDFTFELTGDASETATQSGTSYTFTGLDDGLYMVEVTDENGCTSSTPFNIVLDELVDLQIFAVGTDPNCDDGPESGSIDVSIVAGGSGATLSYDWYLLPSGQNPIGNIQDPTGLIAGAYDVIVTNEDNQCKDNLNPDIVLEPLVFPVISNISTTDETCTAGLNGAVTFTVSNLETNVGDYEIFDIPGNVTVVPPTPVTNQTVTVEDFAAGAYEVVVTSDEGCSTSQTFAIGTDDVELMIQEVEVMNPRCEGVEDGFIDINSIMNPNGQVTYDWSTGGDTDRIEDLPPGTYTVTVIDDFGCEGVESYTLEYDFDLEIDTIATDPPACPGASDGSAMGEITSLTNASEYEVAWLNAEGNSTETITGPSFSSDNLFSGLTTLIVTETMPVPGCADTIEFVLTPPADPFELGFITINNTVDCNGNNTGSATINLTNIDPDVITAPFNYTWLDENGNVICSISNSNELTHTCDDIPGGDFQVIVSKDGSPCEGVFDGNMSEPPAIAGSVDEVINVDCFGDSTGSVSVTVSGGTPPFQFAWNNNETTEDLQDLPAGDYQLTVTDDNDCMFELLPVAEVTQPTQIDVLITGDNIVCSGDSTAELFADVMGGTLDPGNDYAYQWSDNQTSNPATNLSSGVYLVTVTDDNGCTMDGDSFQVDEQSTSAASNSITIEGNTSVINPSVTEEVFSGETFTISLDAEDPNLVVTGVAWMSLDPEDNIIESDPVSGFIEGDNTGNSFDLTLTLREGTADPQESVLLGVTPFYNGCPGDSTTVRMSVVGNLEPLIPPFISPNGDGVNDEWNIKAAAGTEVEDYNIQLFNRQGGRVMQANSIDMINTNDWVTNCPDGTYFYVIEVDSERLRETFSGTLNIQR